MPRATRKGSARHQLRSPALNIILLPEKRKKEIELEIERGELTRGAFLTILTYKFIGGTIMCVCQCV